MTQLFEIKVNLSENQKRNVSRAFHQRETFIGTWEQMRGGGKKTQSSKKGQGLLLGLGANSPFKNIPILGTTLLEWCRYLKIPIKDVLSRDQAVPHNHRQALFI